MQKFKQITLSDLGNGGCNFGDLRYNTYRPILLALACSHHHRALKYQPLCTSIKSNIISTINYRNIDQSICQQKSFNDFV